VSQGFGSVRSVDPDALLADLDASQRRAVTEPALPLAILAPAGSGKTRVLTRRIAWQSATEAIEPAHTLALTFTRKAAGELRARLRRLGIRDDPTAGTFHAVALAQLRALHEHRSTRVPELLDRKARVLAPLVGARRGPDQQLAVLEVAGEIEWAQARLAGPAVYAEAAVRAGRSPKLPLERIAEIYRRYQDEKRRRGVIDFDDLIRLTAHALETDAEFAATQRWRFRHLFVDEFQDVSRAQLRLLRAWLADRDALCVVGDPDQAIYSFAGADPHYLTQFGRHFDGGTTVRLEVNYRSTPEIVHAARAVLPRRERADVRAAGPAGPAPTVSSYANGEAEARGVAQRIREAHSGRRWSDLAVLYRVNAQSAPFEEALRRAGVPFRVRGDRAFLDRAEVRKALAELEKNAAAAPGRDFAEHLTDLVVDATEAGDDERAHREAIVGLGHEYLAVATGRGTVVEFLEFLRTALRGQDDGGVADDAVELLTFHRAKGLEWDTVFVTGLERGLVPISHAHGDAEALDEERRLLYVALSRAERALHVSWASERDRGGARSSTRTPSPYLVELERALAGEEPEDTGLATNQRGARAARERLNAAADAELTPDDRRVFDDLVAWRLDVARAAAVPAFVVFDNKVLRSLARRRPASAAELLTVSGVGPTKLERYGAAVLEIVGRHAASSPA
jgi:DNA helicase-2/ATP-dependent DNA helicase PcrA